MSFQFLFTTVHSTFQVVILQKQLPIVADRTGSVKYFNTKIMSVASIVMALRAVFYCCDTRVYAFCIYTLNEIKVVIMDSQYNDIKYNNYLKQQNNCTKYSQVVD